MPSPSVEIQQIANYLVADTWIDPNLPILLLLIVLARLLGICHHRCQAKSSGEPSITTVNVDAGRIPSKQAGQLSSMKTINSRVQLSIQESATCVRKETDVSESRTRVSHGRVFTLQITWVVRLSCCHVGFE